MGQETFSGMKRNELESLLLRLAEFYANIAMSDIFLNGAAVSSEGVLLYPYNNPDNLEPKNRELFSQGRLSTVRPEEIGIKVKNGANPPIIYLIPPMSIIKLGFREYKRRRTGRILQPSIMLFHGIDQKGQAITDTVADDYLLMNGLTHYSNQRIKSRGIDTVKDLGTSPRTVTRNALADIASNVGVGRIESAIEKAIDESSLNGSGEEYSAAAADFLRKSHK